jgi:glycosyltransferase 2 family protein
MRTHLRTAVVVLLAVGLLGLFLRNADLRQVAGEMGRARLDLVALAVAVTGVTYLLRAWRWQYMLQPIGTVRFATAFRTTVIGFAANTVLPARAGEFLRPYLLARREGLSASSAFATIMLERVLDTVTVLLLFGAFLVAFDPGMDRLDGTTFTRLKIGGLFASGASALVLVTMFFLAGHPATLQRLIVALHRVLPERLATIAVRLAKTFSAGLAIVRQPARFAIVLLMSIPLWLSIATGIWLVTQAFHIEMPFTGSFLIMALLVVGVAVPTPGAVGGFHYFYQLAVMAFYGAPTDRAVGAAIVMHAVSFVPVALVGLVMLAQEGLSLSRVGSLARAGGAEEAA